MGESNSPLRERIIDPTYQDISDPQDSPADSLRATRQCLRKGCENRYQPRQWNQSFCQEPDCQSEVKRWQAAKRQQKWRADDDNRRRQASRDRERRHKQRQQVHATADVAVAQWAEIRRLSEVEKLSGRAIALRVGCSRRTVGRALGMEQAPLPGRPVQSRARGLDPFKPRIKAIIDQYPNLSAVRILEKISVSDDQRPGYAGGITQLRSYLRTIRPQSGRVYQDIVYSPGEAVQIDWGDVGSIKINNTVRRISVFVGVLCYSRMLFIEFTLSQRKAEFYRCLNNALQFFGGSPRKVVFDNLKAAVLSGSGRQATLHPEFLALCGHYCLEPIACAARDPESKGMVESNVGYVKRNALQGRDVELQNWDDYRYLAMHWRDNVANVRLHDRLKERPIDRCLPLHSFSPGARS